MPERPSAGAPPRGSRAFRNRRFLIVLSYFWLLALVPLAAKNTDREVRWHARHGLLLFGVEVALFFVMSMLGAGLLERLVVPIAQLGIVILHTLCIVRGLQGKRLQIPGLSEYADRL